MNLSEWAIVALVIILVIAVVVPRIHQLNALNAVHKLSGDAPTKQPAPPPKMVGINTSETAAASVMPYPRGAGKGAKQVEPSQDMIDTYYTSGRAEVPEQYCAKPIGACPPSKAMSTNLPIANVPMCIALESESMRLNMA